ncbi:Mannose-6-phosphate isomerase [Actinomortierella ambigua]|nr:Mannose-6-phosphate isomerase [Actinomortierella ambigua]
MSPPQHPIFRLECKVQSYEWGKIGSSSKVARFAASAPSFQLDENKPYAELWMGTHPNAPSTVYGTNKTLESVLAADPSLVTPHLHRQYNGHLPFLFKVLSIEKALSIQAHPDKQLAAKLFKEHPQHYKDPNHKPEMAIALTEFEALCGFRPLDEIAAAFDTWPELRNLVSEAVARDFQETIERASAMEGIKGIKEGRQALQTVFKAVMTADDTRVKQELDTLITRLSQQNESTPFEPRTIEEVLLRVHSQFPGDVGVFCIFLLNYVVLEPGRAIFLAANEPHAYLSGDCVECMAASDNVVRSGLTPKFKDVDVLVSMLTYQAKPSSDQLLSGTLCTPTGHSLLYDPPIEEFSIVLTKLDHANEMEMLRATEGPSIVLVTSGKGVLRSDKSNDNNGNQGSEATPFEALVEPGHVYFVGANTPFTIEATDQEGVTIYTAFSVRPDKKDHFHH